VKRWKQLLDWWIKGYSIQPENQLQVEFIKYCIATHYIPNGDGTFTFSSSLAELHPWVKTSEEVTEEISENSSPKTARKLRRERTPTSNDRLNPFLMSSVWEKEDIQYDMNQTFSHEKLKAMEERFTSPYKRLNVDEELDDDVV
jgi:hypothetical protein